MHHRCCRLLVSFAMPMIHQPWSDIDSAAPPIIDPECAAAVLMGYSSVREPSSVEIGAIQEAMCLALLVQVGHRSRADGLAMTLLYRGDRAIGISKAKLPFSFSFSTSLSISASACVCICVTPLLPLRPAAQCGCTSSLSQATSSLLQTRSYRAQSSSSKCPISPSQHT